MVARTSRPPAWRDAAVTMAMIRYGAPAAVPSSPSRAHQSRSPSTNSSGNFAMWMATQLVGLVQPSNAPIKLLADPRYLRQGLHNPSLDPRQMPCSLCPI
jgi:hypothetical protein